MTVPVEQVAAVPLFSGLDADTQSRIAGWFDERSYDAGDKVVRAGADGYSFFVLLSGQLSVMAPNDTVRSLEPGDFFGEIGMISGARRSATITADTEVTALEMFGTHFRELQMELPAVGAMIEEEMATREARDRE